MKKVSRNISLLITTGILLICSSPSPAQNGLKDYVGDRFLIGVAIPGRFLKDSDELALVKKHFNSITSENDMKWMNIHPRRDVYNFEIPDRLVELKQENDMFLVGHTLVWHSQLARYVLKPIPTGDPSKDTLMVDAPTLQGYIKEHIETIVGRYKGQVDGWDVVNEALNEDGSLRESGFLKVLGAEYIPFAFMTAHEADPEAELYYNDYNLVQAKKRDGAIRLIRDLQEKGVKIDGVGIQAHWGLNYPSIEEIEEAIELFADTGVKVMFTELDISVLPSPWRMPTADVNVRFSNNETMNPYTDGLPDSVQNQLADRYAQIFSLFKKHEDKISRVTFWGLHDGVSWKNGFPIRGRTDYPLLFDRQMQPKKAFDSVIQTMEE
jgi:endo-1,4-beta-xylanase